MGREKCLENSLTHTSLLKQRMNIRDQQDYGTMLDFDLKGHIKMLLCFKYTFCNSLNRFGCKDV